MALGAVLQSPRLHVAMLVPAFWPVWRWYGERMWDGSDEPLGLVALAAAAIIALSRSREMQLPRAAGVLTRWDAVLCVAVIGYAYLASSMPMLLQAALAIAATVALLGAHRKLPPAAAAWGGLLLLSLPLLSSLEFFLGYPLRCMLAACVSWLLSVVGGLAVSAHGTILEWNGKEVVIDSPCSGVQMLWMGCALSLSLLAIRGAGSREAVAGLARALRIVFCVNVLRVFLLFYKESGIVTLPSWTHAGIGLLCFGLAVILIARGELRSGWRTI